MIKAVIFDMDGVLIDATDWHYHALNEALSLFGLEISRELHTYKYDGFPTKTKLNILVKEGVLPKELVSFVSELKQIYTHNYIQLNCHPVFHHKYLLGELKKNGYKLGLCSNSIRETVEMMLSKSELLSYFDFIFSNQDVTNPKPSPEIYNKCLKAMQVSPKEALIIEDNEYGLKAARASGANVLAVKNPSEVTYENISKKLSKFI